MILVVRVNVPSSYNGSIPIVPDILLVVQRRRVNGPPSHWSWPSIPIPMQSRWPGRDHHNVKFETEHHTPLLGPLDHWHEPASHRQLPRRPPTRQTIPPAVHRPTPCIVMYDTPFLVQSLRLGVPSWHWPPPVLRTMRYVNNDPDLRASYDYYSTKHRYTVIAVSRYNPTFVLRHLLRVPTYSSRLRRYRHFRLGPT